MIVSFRVGNFVSFAKEQTIKFQATQDKAHQETHCVPTRFRALPRLTRTAVIIGPGASGKSNLLLALSVMRDLVLHSTAFSQAQFAERYRPFGLGASNNEPTVFHIELYLHGIRYLYGFSYNAEHIVSESLHVFRNSKSQRWFERRSQDMQHEEVWEPFSPSFLGPRGVWRRSTRPQALFLTTAAQLNAEQLRPVVHWFEHQMEIVLSSSTINLRMFAARLKEDDFKSKVLGILQATDIPAVDVRVNEPEANPKDARASSASPRVELLYAPNGNSATWFDTRHDSAGVLRLLSTVTPLLDGVERDRFIAFDEFDSHLHPLVARFLLRMINDPQATHRRVQVLLVTHTTALMDLEILRRDELWLMKLDSQRASQLVSFALEKARKHTIIAKAYLQGDYGAIPRIDLSRLALAKPTDGQA